MDSKVYDKRNALKIRIIIIIIAWILLTGCAF